jgi:ornithine decarboxylase
VKCNPDENIVSTLATCGASFDCASIPEIELALKYGKDPNRIIFANPCKAPGAIKVAKKNNVSLMTFDNIEELSKVKNYYPEARCVLRILGDDSHSKEPFGSKFGAIVPHESDELLQYAKDKGLNVVGVSFHVGSGAFNATGYVNSIKMARSVFDKAISLGFKMELLDIGGGWPGTDEKNLIKSIADEINPLIDTLFDKEVKVIAEPGRYFATECVTLAVSIIGKRVRFLGENKSKQIFYYLSDGIYGSFNNIVFDHAEPEYLMHILKATPHDDHQITEGLQDGTESTLFGPTCDSIDVILKNIKLPNLEIGDWLYFSHMGAYTSAAASSFNGFKTPTPIYIVH